VDAIDCMVGLLAEEPLPGYIFGEAIYSIFVLQVCLFVCVGGGGCCQSILQVCMRVRWWGGRGHYLSVLQK
jgi:hypothetical protein